MSTTTPGVATGAAKDLAQLDTLAKKLLVIEETLQVPGVAESDTVEMVKERSDLLEQVHDLLIQRAQRSKSPSSTPMDDYSQVLQHSGPKSVSSGRDLLRRLCKSGEK